MMKLVMSSKSSRVQSLRSEMPLDTDSESMFEGHCIQTTKWKAFIFLLEKKQRQASKVNPQARKADVKRQGSLHCRLHIIAT